MTFPIKSYTFRAYEGICVIACVPEQEVAHKFYHEFLASNREERWTNREIFLSKIKIRCPNLVFIQADLTQIGDLHIEEYVFVLRGYFYFVKNKVDLLK